MGKRLVVFSLIGFFLVAGAAVVTGVVLFSDRLPFDLPFLGSKPFTEVIPAKRPLRLDRRQLDRFVDSDMDLILRTLLAEAEQEEGEGVTEEAKLLESLPDAPLPFPADAKARDEAWLKALVTQAEKKETAAAQPHTAATASAVSSDAQEGQVSKPTLLDRWKFNLALAGLGVLPEQVPAAVKLETGPEPESDIFPSRLVPKTNSLLGPFAFGNLDDTPEWEVITEGGAGIVTVMADGTVKPLEGLRHVLGGIAVIPADYDSDGDLDVFIIRGRGLPNSLMRNDGAGKFEDVTIEVGLLSFSDTTCAAWLDYDGDGLLDVLVGSSDHPLELYRQTTGGAFQPVAWDLGLWVPRGVSSVAVADVDRDGAPDFYVGIEGLADRLYRNQPGAVWDAWRFSPVTLPHHAWEVARAGLAVFTDLNNDGRVDLIRGARGGAPFVPGAPTSTETSPGAIQILLNQDGASFADVTSQLDLNGPLTVVEHLAVLDLDYDGYEDILVSTPSLYPNRVLWNTGGDWFKEVTSVSRGGFLDQARFLVADLTGNGALDVLTHSHPSASRWLECQDATGSWLRIDVEGHQLGTRIRLQVRDRDWIVHPIDRTLGYDSRITVGLGVAERVESIELFPPGSSDPIKTVEKLEPNSVVTIQMPKLPKSRAVVPIGDSAND